jgi:UDP-3-O-[3-hydroxymyristoyl] N-acetylglucosamine deacetylase / 3-hydroxyacyl-[acyl-carrier-protein] dehydratase
MRSVLHQQTLRNPASFSGTGLHSGSRVNMTVLPAPPNSGIRFRRLDLDGKPEIEAKIDFVSTTNRSTTLSKGNAKIHTVEHVLAAFAGCGVDNAIVELDANEPPIADGSSREFLRMIKEAGLAEQDAPREVFAVKEAIRLEMGESLLSIFPYDGFRISCTSADKQGRFTQFLTIDVNAETWERDLAHARTFCFFEEIEFLIKSGLIKGGSLENAVVIREDAILTTEPLRYPDEFVRHKILDIIGDLSLIGIPIKGHLIAVRPGHAANCELGRQILAQKLKPTVAAQSFGPPPSAPEKEAPAEEKPLPPELTATALDTIQLMKILPHRYPFMMVDRVASIEGDKITAVKNVTINEPYFQGHFPGHPIMPGVLQLEAMAQVAGILMLRRAENIGKIAYFMSAEKVKWRKPVRPGDVLVIEVEVIKMRGKIGRANGQCLVNGEKVSEAEVTFTLAPA